jgi:hypothetical protein
MASKVNLDDMAPCDDPDCAFCGDDDYEAAFWDEFFCLNEEVAEKGKGERFTIKVVNERTGKEAVFEELRAPKHAEVLKGD